MSEVEVHDDRVASPVVLGPRGRASGAARVDTWNAVRPGTHGFDTACVAPWVSLEFDPEGWVLACCASQLYPLGRIGDERLTDVWNGPRAEVLKQALLDWDLSVACQPCRFGIDHGNTEPVAAVYDRYPVGVDRPEFPHVMTFALSNRCNLACVMCTPALSSRLRAEAGMAPAASPYGEQFFDDLEPFLPSLQVAKFLGGEPFLVSEHRRVWEAMDRLGVSPKIEVTTNGTVWTPLVDWVTTRFEVDISVSVDAMTADTYRDVRGGELAVVEANLERFAERCSARGTNLHLSFCLMQPNWHELAPFLAWAEQYTFGPPVTVSNVATRGLSLLDLPTPDLEEIRAGWAADEGRYGPSLERNRPVWDDQRRLLDAVIVERTRGVPVGAPRANRAGRETFAGPCPPVAADDVAIATQIELLRRWAQAGPVGRIDVDHGGVIRRVGAPHRRLGVTVALEGTPLVDLVGAISAADGRLAWVIDSDEQPGVVVRSFVLADSDPVRGVRGASVRTVQMPTAEGSTVLVAEDTIYERPETPAGAADPAASAPGGIAVAFRDRQGPEV